MPNLSSDISDATTITYDTTGRTEETTFSGFITSTEITGGSSDDVTIVPGVLDLVTLVCTDDFAWANDDPVAVPCPTADGDFRGLIALATRTRTFPMDGVTYTSGAFVTRPPLLGGSITGFSLPGAIVLHGDDVFRARIGCVDGFPECDAEVRVIARLDGEPEIAMGSWTVRAGEPSQAIELRLAFGVSPIELELDAVGNANPEVDLVLWAEPTIESPSD